MSRSIPGTPWSGSIASGIASIRFVATTDEGGVATFVLPPHLRGGKHTFEASFAGDNDFGSSSAQTET